MEKLLMGKSKMKKTYKITFYAELTEDDVKAKYNNGILELFVPKKEKQIPEKRNIAIE